MVLISSSRPTKNGRRGRFASTNFFLLFPAGGGQALDLLGVAEDGLPLHGHAVDQVQRLVGAILRQHLLQGIEILLM